MKSFPEENNLILITTQVSWVVRHAPDHNQQYFAYQFVFQQQDLNSNKNNRGALPTVRLHPLLWIIHFRSRSLCK